MFATIAVIAVVLSRWNRAHLRRFLTWLPFGGAFALMIAVAWGYTVGNTSIQDDYGDAMSCLGERLTSRDSRLIPFLSCDYVTQSRIDVLTALLAAVVIVLIEYRILLSLRQGTEGVTLPCRPWNDERWRRPRGRRHRSSQDRVLAVHFFLAGAWPSSAAVTVTGEAPSVESAAGAACSTVKGPVTLAASVRSARTASMASAYSGRSAATASSTERIGVF